jgi:hypothetical protein
MIITSRDNANTNETARHRLLADLRELVEALDRRVPHVEREGEARIARDAAALRKTAEERITQLEIDLSR